MELAALITHALLGAFVALVVLEVVLGARGRWARLRARLAADPGARTRYYRRAILGAWATATVAPVVVLVSPALSWKDLGWALPARNGAGNLWAGVGLAGYLMLVTLVSTVRLRHALRRGRRFPGRAAIDLILPRTPGERRLVALLAVTAGITEEVVYRGLLIGAGTELYHLPLAVAAAASLLLFVAGHGYQGRAGLLGSAVLGLALTIVYLITGSLLLVVVIHVWQDLVALLLVPAVSPGSPAETRAQPQPAETRAQPQLAETRAQPQLAEAPPTPEASGTQEPARPTIRTPYPS